jgi:hypothetical protein
MLIWRVLSGVHKKEEVKIQTKKIQEKISHPGKLRGRASQYSENRAKRVLTVYEVQRGKWVKMPKESEGERDKSELEEKPRERGASHRLSSVDAQTSQDNKRKRESEGHSLTVERRQTDKSGQQEKARDRGALTPYRAQTDGQVRTARESDGGEEHSRTVERRRTDE